MAQHVKRIKIRRKDLRRPDEFHSLSTQAAEWVQQNRAIALGALGVIVAVFVAVGATGWYRSARAETAAERFHAAHATFESGKYSEAADAFGELERGYGGTPFGHLAGLYRAHALMRQGDAAAAATAYGEYLATSPPAEYLRQEALDGLAHAKEAGGDAAGALDAYTQAGQVSGPYRIDALLAAARLHDAAGQLDQARAIYA